MEKNDMSLVELEELEAFEIDAALLRDLLEEDSKVDDGGVKQLMEADEDKNIMTDKEKQQQRWLEQNECHAHDFKWLNMMEMEMEMETVPPNDAIVDWFHDDIAGVVDFGYTNCEYDCYSQICDVLISNEASYGGLWENL